MKLTTRMSDPSQVERIRRLMGSRTSDLNIEIQQRAVEYGNMFGYDNIRRGVLEKMPPPEVKEEQRVFGPSSTSAKDKRKTQLKDKTKKNIAKKTEQDMLLDLMGGGDIPAVDASATLNGQQNTADLLADILGGGNSVSSPPPQTRSPPLAQSNADSIMDLLGNGTSSTPKPAAPVSSGAPAHPVYNKNDLQVTMQISRSAAGVQALARFKNSSNFDRFTGVGLQAAVPKSQKLTLQAINKATLEGGDEATQGMRIVGATGVSHTNATLMVQEANIKQALPPKLRLRLKISYQKDDGSPALTEQVDWTEP